MNELISKDPKEPMIIDDNTSVTGELRILPNGKDELSLNLGWMRLGDLMRMLHSLYTQK